MNLLNGVVIVALSPSAVHPDRFPVSRGSHNATNHRLDVMWRARSISLRSFISLVTFDTADEALTSCVSDLFVSHVKCFFRVDFKNIVFDVSLLVTVGVTWLCSLYKLLISAWQSVCARACSMWSWYSPCSCGWALSCFCIYQRVCGSSSLYPCVFRFWRTHLLVHVRFRTFLADLVLWRVPR